VGDLFPDGAVRTKVMITPKVTHPAILALFADDVSHELQLFEISEQLNREEITQGLRYAGELYFNLLILLDLRYIALVIRPATFQLKAAT
jgi:hypothetical protein